MGFVYDLVQNDEAVYNIGNIVVFTFLKVSSNVDFNPEEGFTCREAGFYSFSLHLVGRYGQTVEVAIVKGSTELVRAGTRDESFNAAASTSVVVELAAGDVVFTKCVSQVCAVKGHSRFTGRKLIGKKAKPA